MEGSRLPRALGGPPAEMSAMRKASWHYLPAEDQVQLESLYKTPSQIKLLLPETADPEAYYNARTKDTEASYEATKMEIKMFKQALKDKKIYQKTYSEVVEGLKDIIEANEIELRVLKRQKTHLVQDAEEMIAPKTTVFQSWLSLLLDKITLATKQKAKKKFPRGDFRNGCLEYYGAEKIVNLPPTEEVPAGFKHKWQYCVVSGEWFPESLSPDGNGEYEKPRTQIIAAHIVPEVVDGSELNQLFNVGETMLAEPRNSLPLLKTIESALDNGVIAIVPNQMNGPRVETYKMVLVDSAKKNVAYYGQGKRTRKWSSIDGKILKFLTPEEVKSARATLPEEIQKRLNKRSTPEAVAANRPAQRYLYFRAMATYFLAKRNLAENPSLASWIKSYEAERGTMWLTPGKYARQSMMTELAMAAGDMYLPEARAMFGVSGGIGQLALSEKPEDKKEWDSEELNAMCLKQKLLENKKNPKQGDDATEEDDSDEEEDEE